MELASTPLSPSARLRCDAIFRLLGGLTDVRSLMEIGSGQGALAVLLARRYDYRGYEPDPSSFRVARARLEQQGRGDVRNAPVPADPDRVFDVVGAFEVLEHQEDDRAALDVWARWVRPGGRLLLSVPAHPERFGRADRYVGHFRRYTRRGLSSLMRDAGLEDIQIVTYGFPLGHLLERCRNGLLALRADEPGDARLRTLASGRQLQPGARLAPLIWAGTLPFRLMQRPFASGDLGTGFVVSARKPA